MQQTSLCPICNHHSHYDFSGRDLMFNKFERYDYYRCQNCEFIFQHPLPSPATIASFYPDNYDVYEEETRIKNISVVRKAILKKYYGYKHLDVPAYLMFISPLLKLLYKQHEIAYINNGYLLDIGCGNGRFLEGMKSLGWQVKGVEFNAHAVEVCQKSLLDVHHGDLKSANFPSTSFDIVNISHVIEHVPNTLEFIAEVARITKPNGQVFIKTPNNDALGRSFFATNWYANEVPRHLYLFSKKNLAQLAHTHDFGVSHIETSSTAKIILNSYDYVVKNHGKASKRVKWKRFIAKIYVFFARRTQRGDEIAVTFIKK
jgi:2-polyprenyl-3-methyl-5-hydroxy-6-metoxy-1,4-benzoquinol methylase